MSQYRTREMAVEAFRLPPEGDHDLAAFHAWAASVGFDDFESDRRGAMAVRTERGVAVARPGDWIAKGPSGAFAVLKPEEFDALIEPVPPPAPVPLVPMPERVKLYLRLVARELIDGDEGEQLWQRRDGLWERMDQAERDETNRIVIEVFGEWYDPADPGPTSGPGGSENPNVTEDGDGTAKAQDGGAAGGGPGGGRTGDSGGDAAARPGT
jgi:hypothetical protein